MHDPTTRTYRFFSYMLAHRRISLAVIVLMTAGLGALASKVRPDFSIELSFPTFHESRVNYEDYKDSFPTEDSQALVILESPQLYTPAGIARIAALEEDLATIAGVLDVEGLTTTKDVVSEGDGFILSEPVFPTDRALDQGEIDRRRAVATSDPMFAWILSPPDGRAAIIRVNLATDSVSDEAGRKAFIAAARTIVAKHDAVAAASGTEQSIRLGGIPVVRSQYTELVTSDLNKMFPIAFLLILVILFATFRRFRDVSSAWITIVISVLWTVGFMGAVGFSMQMLTQLTPIIVMIISISDTVHIVSHYREALSRGLEKKAAIAESLSLNVWPCLLTEIAIAGGFLSLVTNDMVATQQFGIVTAAGMMLTWLANVTVLPLALSLFKVKERDRGEAGEGVVTRQIKRGIGRIETMVINNRRRIVAITLLLVGSAIFAASHVDAEYMANADLRPESSLYQNLEYVEQIHGGNHPLAIHITADRPDAMLEPESIACLDRITAHLESNVPYVRNATSFSKLMRKSHRLFAGEEIAAQMPLPRSRKLAAQELTAIDDPTTMRHILSFDRSEAAISASMPDIPSSEIAGILADLNAYLATEEQLTGFKIKATGIFALQHGIYDTMVGGMAKSLGLAVLLSFFIFCFVLRSWRLGLIALVPNLLPLLTTLALMAVFGIELKPTTVVLFSVTLVIADDDTIQFLSRFRRRFLSLKKDGHHDPHTQASLETLRETGVPMVITTVTISTGFLVLLGSEFLGLHHLGLLTGISLVTAVFADLFLSPLLLSTLKPRIGAGRGRLPTASVPARSAAKGGLR